MWNTVLPFHSPLQDNAISLRRKLDSVFLDYPKLSLRGGHRLMGDSRRSALFHVKQRPPRHVKLFGPLHANHFAVRGAGPERSTWNIDLARAANGCESGGFLEEIAGSSLF